MARKDLVDLIGKRFGARIAVEYAGLKKWLTRCDCGKEFVTDGADLRRRTYICNHISDHRFFAKIEKTASCWIWRGAINSDGYGSFKVDGKTMSAHLYSWRLANDRVPEDKELDHLCRNRACVNPAHLEPVTHAENVRRGKLGEVTAKRFAERRKS